MSRRSRRKKSPCKSGRFRLSRWIAGGAVFLVLLLIAAVFFGYQAVRSYLKSDDFRVMLEEKTGDALDAQASFDGFVWDGWSVRSAGIEVVGEEVIQALAVNDIEASVAIGAVWEGVYRIEDVSVRKVDLKGDFRIPMRKKEEEPEKQLSFWERFLPQDVEVSSLKVASLSGLAKTEGGVWAVSGSSLDVLAGTGKKSYDFTLRDGDISAPLPIVQGLKLKEAKGRYSNDFVYLLSSDLEVFESGQLTLSGDYDIEEGEWGFSGGLNGVQLEEVMPEDWKQRLIGGIRVDFRARGEKEGEPVISGELEIERGALTALPILDRIAAYTNTERFRRLELREARLDFKKQGEVLELRGIKLASEGLVRIEGDLVLEGNVIRSGLFNLGVTPGTLIHLPGAETKVFQRGKEGMLWTPIRVGGTLDSPTEDLSERLIRAAGERMFELIPETGAWALKYTKEKIGGQTKELLSKHGVILGVANSLLGGGKGVLNRGAEAVEGVLKGVIGEGTQNTGEATKEAVNTIFDIFGRPIEKKK